MPPRRPPASVWPRRTGPGSALPRSLAQPLRTHSIIAPRMCPPSSGSSGSMFSRNRLMLNPATRFRNSTHLSVVLVFSESRISPPIRPAPTMPTGEFRSRGASLKIASHSAGIRAGMATTALAAAPMKSPVRPIAAPNDCGDVRRGHRDARGSPAVLDADLVALRRPAPAAGSRTIGDCLGDLLAVADVVELHRLPGGGPDQVGQLVPAGHRDAVEADDGVTGQQSGDRGRGRRVGRAAFGLLGRCRRRRPGSRTG